MHSQTLHALIVLLLVSLLYCEQKFGLSTSVFFVCPDLAEIPEFETAIVTTSDQLETSVLHSHAADSLSMGTLDLLNDLIG